MNVPCLLKYYNVMINKIIKNINPIHILSLVVQSLSWVGKIRRGQIKEFCQRYIGVVYCGLIGFNLILLNHYIFLILKFKQPDYYYFQAAVIYFNPHKRAELVEYISGCVLLGIWFLIMSLGGSNLNPVAGKYLQTTLRAIAGLKNRLLSSLVFGVTLLIPVVVLSIKHYNVTTVIVQFICLLSAVVIPLWSYLLTYGSKDFFCNKPNKEAVPSKLTTPISPVNSRWLILLIIIGFLFLIYIFYIPIFKKPQIINEYFNIPEQTILVKKVNDKKIVTTVDNTEYWQQHFSLAITRKTDVRNLSYNDNCLFATPQELGIYTPGFFESNIYYNPATKQTCLNGGIPLENFHNVTNPNLFGILDRNNSDSQQQQLKNYSDEELQFISENKYEIHWQTLSRFMIHHNSFMFIPIAGLMQGELIGAINAQYGTVNAFMFAKIYEKISGISLDKWLKISYLFYFVYFVLLLISILIITRNLFISTALFILSLATINFHGYDFALLAPGDSPWRNLFDMSVVLLLYLSTGKNRVFYYVCALFLCLLSILLNPQIGVMVLAAVVLSGLFDTIFKEKNIKRFIVLNAIVVLVGLFLYKLGVGHDDLANYYIDGVVGIKVNVTMILYTFICSICCYMILSRLLIRHCYKNYMYLLFLIIYSQELFLYVVWHFNLDGFIARSHIYLLTACLLLFEMARHKNLNKIFNYLMIGILVVYMVSLGHMVSTKNQYEQIFKQHVTYEWNLDRAHITTTMNPIYFENSVKLINKYSPESSGIYIISEYDNFLPFLAHKYSLMPFFDMKWYLITPKELNKTIRLLREAKPEYLFVDTDIDRNLNNEIIDPGFPEIGYLNQESIWRVQRLKLLNMIYQGVAQNYTLVESGSLISVYKLNTMQTAAGG